MYVQQPKLEWHYLSEDDAEAPWPPAQEESAAETQARTHALARVLFFGVALVIALAAGAELARTRSHALQGVAEVEKGVQAAVDAEEWVQEHAPDLSAALIADDLANRYVANMVEAEQDVLAAFAHRESPAFALRIQETRFAGPFAAADVELALAYAAAGVDAVHDLDAGHSVAAVYHETFRQTRFYRETPQGWLRTRPVPALWGPQRSFETDHLVWRFRQRDEETVRAVAQELDALYAQWRRDHALADARVQKLVVDVRVDFLPSQVRLQPGADVQVTVPSPAVYLAPLRYSDEALLVQSVAIALMKSVRQESITQGHGSKANGALSAIDLWEMMDAGMPLFEPGEAFLGWYVDEAGWYADNAPVVLQGRVDDVCATFGVWMISPTAVEIPVSCEHNAAESMVDATQFTSKRIPPQLGPASYEQEMNYTGAYQATWGRTMLLATVIDYAEATYGRERLPVLVTAMSEHGSWETLAPDVYGVPFEEFEAGWQAHLAQLVE